MLLLISKCHFRASNRGPIEQIIDKIIIKLLERETICVNYLSLCVSQQCSKAVSANSETAKYIFFKNSAIITSLVRSVV